MRNGGLPSIESSACFFAYRESLILCHFLIFLMYLSENVFFAAYDPLLPISCSMHIILFIYILPDSPDKAGKDALKRTLQVSNLSPLLTVDQLKQLFAYCGTVVDCTITDSKHFAYIEFSKPEEATTALALNNMDVGGRPLNVEMAKSLPSKSSLANSLSAQSSIPLMMQQAVAMQQMNFQQALLMQQTIASQQAANRAATMKSATEMASARAAEISKKLKADGLGSDDKEEEKKKSRYWNVEQSCIPLPFLAIALCIFFLGCLA